MWYICSGREHGTYMKYNPFWETIPACSTPCSRRKNERTGFFCAYMLGRLSRNVFQKVVGVPEHRKAVAFSIFVKTKRPCSVLKDWSYRELSRLTGLSPNTCRKRVCCLESLGLVTREEKGGHTYLRFSPLRRGVIRTRRRTWRPKDADVNIVGFSGGSIKDIERGLMALVIVEDCNRKEYVRQLTISAHNPSKCVSSRRIKKAKAICSKRGYGETFRDYGLSYRRIGEWLHCGPNRVREIIGFGESTEMFEAQRSGFVLLKYERNGAKFAVEYLQQEVDFPIFATRHNVFRRPANRFSLAGIYCRNI